MASTAFKLRASTSTTAPRRSQACAKPDGVAAWLINGLTGAFFASLERCSCIRISTHEDDFGSDEATDIPLIFNDAGHHLQPHDGNLTRRRRIGKGRELVRAASARSIGSRVGGDYKDSGGPPAMPPRSSSVAMGRIDEDQPCCTFGEEIINNGNDFIKLKYPRSRSHAVARSTAIR